MTGDPGRHRDDSGGDVPVAYTIGQPERGQQPAPAQRPDDVRLIEGREHRSQDREAGHHHTARWSLVVPDGQCVSGPY